MTNQARLEQERVKTQERMSSRQKNPNPNLDLYLTSYQKLEMGHRANVKAKTTRNKGDYGVSKILRKKKVLTINLKIT